jgi:hypothetical protein
VNTANKPKPKPTQLTWAYKSRTSAVLFCWLAKGAYTKQGECGALVVGLYEHGFNRFVSIGACFLYNGLVGVLRSGWACFKVVGLICEAY